MVPTGFDERAGATAVLQANARRRYVPTSSVGASMATRVISGVTLVLILAIAMANVALAGGVADFDDVARRKDDVAPLELPDLGRVVRVFDTSNGSEIRLAQMIDGLVGYDAIFLGETHLDETTHRVERFVYEWLATRTSGKVVLAMEMFERDVQSVVDDYLAGRIEEPEFLAKSRPWSNYVTDYRPLIEYAREHHLPVVAGNFPMPIRRKLRGGGKEAYEALGEDDRKWLPKELHPDSDAYWERFARTLRGHFGAMIPKDSESRLYSTQCLWDNSMGEACAIALTKYPGYKVLHVSGGFHTLYQQGTAEQFQLRSPASRVANVDIDLVGDLAVSDWERDDDAPPANFIVFAESRARSLQDGKHAVSVRRELEFALRMPKKAQTASVPLLVWLPPNGLRAEDGMAAMRLEFKDDDIAIAVIESPFPEMAEDLHRGGRWYWEEDFSAHVGAMTSGLVRVVARILEEYPIDRSRVVLSGRGDAATVIASTMLYASGVMPVQAFAFQPSHYVKLREGGLPRYAEPAEPRWPFVYRDLQIYADADGEAWWQQEAADYRKTGLRVGLEVVGGNAAWQRENVLRLALGLDELQVGGGAVDVIIRHDSTLARHWGELEVRAWRAKGRPARLFTAAEWQSDAAKSARLESSAPNELVVLYFAGVEGGRDPTPGLTPAQLDFPGAVPPAPGPFGGTTVLVTYPGLDEATRAAWTELETRSGLIGRFSQIKIAHVDASPSIPEVLDGIRDAGRSNVLLVPAAYCATADEMRSLRAIAKDHLHGLTVSWQPGLGGRLHERHRN